MKFFAEQVEIKPENGGLHTCFNRLEVSAPSESAIMEAIWNRGYRSGWILVKYDRFIQVP